MSIKDLTFNHHADRPDHRDYGYQPSASIALPPRVDLRRSHYGFPAIYEQGHLNSCTANAVAAVLAFDIRRQRLDTTFEPSRLFVYYNERKRAHALHQASYGDHGCPAYMRDCIQSVAETGFCSEAEWPYDESKFDAQPPDSAYNSALRHRACEYRRIFPVTPGNNNGLGGFDVRLLKACLAEGYPFVCGIAVFPTFANDAVRHTGLIPMPIGDQPRLGGHAVAIVGYDDGHEHFIVRNSLGEGWGDHGHGYIPYAYLCDSRYAMDFWTIRKVDVTAEHGQAAVLLAQDVHSGSSIEMRPSGCELQ